MSKTKSKTGKGRFQNMAIAKKITFLYGGIFSLSMLVISAFVVGNAVLVRESAVKKEVAKTAEDIAESLSEGMELTEDNITALLSNKYVEVVVVNPKTQASINTSIGPKPPFIMQPRPVAAAVPKEIVPDAQEPDTAENVIDAKVVDIHKITGVDENQMKDFRKDIHDNSREYFIKGEDGIEFVLVERAIENGENSYFIQAYQMISNGAEYFWGLVLRLFFIDLFGIFLAFLVGKYISKLILGPVDNIRQTAERISIEDLSQRIEVPTAEDEMKELTITFNSMIERLETSFMKQNRFVSDASHELRTPISVIQGYANLINRWGKDDPEVLGESIDSIIAETERMTVLIKKLLFLARADQDRMQVQKEKLSLNDMVKEVVKELNIMDTKRKIAYEEENPIILYADGSLLKQLFWIHVENSLKYTKENDTILFRVYEKDGFGCVDIADNGKGIEEEDLPFIFDRFYRADKSRNKEIPGTGLGLSIAKWIIKCHNGEIFVRRKEEGGTVFTDCFPLLKEGIKNEEQEERK